MKFTYLFSDNKVNSALLGNILKQPGFGNYFTDHMISIHYNKTKGWYNPLLEPYKHFSIYPSSSILHYGQGIFEGLKSYLLEGGFFSIFRVNSHAHRFNKSAYRLDLPNMPVDLFLKSIKILLKTDCAWFPNRKIGGLYIRPFMFANDTSLGIHSAKNVVYKLIASPMSSYFSEKHKSISIWVSFKYSRAVYAGTGSVKYIGNYGIAMIAQKEAKKHKCDQVLFLNKYKDYSIQELTGMNIFFVLKNKTLLTPKLDGTILPGITRDSIIQISKDININIQERDITFQELKLKINNCEITEAFASGTASGIVPISKFVTFNETLNVTNKLGKITLLLKNILEDIQKCIKFDDHKWIKKITIN